MLLTLVAGVVVVVVALIIVSIAAAISREMVAIPYQVLAFAIAAVVLILAVLAVHWALNRLFPLLL